MTVLNFSMCTGRSVVLHIVTSNINCNETFCDRNFRRLNIRGEFCNV
jgi:hypothetical protein